MNKLATALDQAMQRYPQQRLLQIIFNALDAKGKARDADSHPRDLFYIDDDTLLTALTDYNE